MDDDIREALRQGDTRKAMGMLAERYRRQVYGRCWQYLRNADDARDAMQQTWTAMLRHGDKLLEVKSLEPWLLRVAGRKCLDILRKGKRAQRLTQALPGEPVAEGRIEQLLHEAQEGHALQDCLAALDPEDQFAVVSRFVDECSWEEVGRELGVAPDTIRMRIGRVVLRRLLDCLARKEIRS